MRTRGAIPQPFIFLLRLSLNLRTHCLMLILPHTPIPIQRVLAISICRAPADLVPAFTRANKVLLPRFIDLAPD
ncbi:hypothetical protein NA56DRAFT_480318 [Hyaloscypha hepaticicola]|uniref:Secreted protein n=1 Tax=Hyaloscypha hepaticicola TaxID=2082293 RepID=A0A2J6PEW8_9HELO|nr:hypothetical protein NA56DRAFT_480318 [Hyaloscypha hepaticicola]